MPSESQLRHSALRHHVRELIENGRLPVMLPHEVHAGYGSGRICAACGERITPSQVEYEVEDSGSDTRLRFHVGCHLVWQVECGRSQAKIPDAQQLR